MKKIIFTLLGMLMITSASAASQPTFIPILSEGKSWQVAAYNDDPNDIIKVYSVSVGGDTIVNNLTCKKIDVVPKDSHMATASPVAYEENGKVWKVEENGQMVLIFDVGLHLNEQFNGVAHVVGEDFVCVNGVSRKRLTIDSGCDCVNYMYYVVEGVGISLDECVMYLGVGNGSHPCRMVSCSENGETIFTYEDFSKQDDYVPLVREGVVWEYVGESDDPLPKHSLYTLEFNGTTTIDGKLYHKIYRTDYDKQGNAQNPYFVAFVREENKIVSVYIDTYEQDEDFYYTYWWMMPKTLYDFSKPMFLPDEAYILFGDDGPYNYNTNYYPSSSIEVEVGETTRKGYFIDHGNDDESFKTIEGIGVDCDFGDLLIPYRTYYTGFNPMASLAAVYENGELVYKGRAYEKAQRLKNPVEGDVNDDGVVTSADITALYNYLLDSDYQYYETSDVDGDGEVTSADVTAVYNILLGNGSNDDNVTEYEVNGVKFKMLKVDGGSFLMGASGDYAEDYDNELPTHQVNLSTYYIGQTEVTQELWQAVMDNNPCKFNGEPYGTNLKRPVENVSWTDCQEFISKLNEMTGKSFRLPTEAEWEYAARGGKMSLGYVFSGSDNFEDVAWCNIPLELEGTLGYGTQTVATKYPNELGLYDMSGNVWEWCQDWFGSYNADAQTNPTGPETGTCRVCRGGSWLGVPKSCVVFLRNYTYQPSMRSSIVGLRLAM